MTTKITESKEKENRDLTIRHFDLEKINDMTAMALVLKTYIVKQGLFTNIKGRNYAHVDGWVVAGAMMNLYPKVVKVENLSGGDEIKWKTDVEITELKSGKVVANGFALCSSKESTKKSFEEYAILSLSQTRAIGKAYRNLIGWVIKLAGYESTPKEEMENQIKQEPENVEKFMEDIQPTDEEVIQWSEKLESARDKKELKAFWETTPQMVKDKLEGLHAQMKTKLK